MKKQHKLTTKLPKDPYRLPNGNYVLRRGPITAIHKDPPDLHKLAMALIRLAEDQARKEQAKLQRDHQQRQAIDGLR